MLLPHSDLHMNTPKLEEILSNSENATIQGRGNAAKDPRFSSIKTPNKPKCHSVKPIPRLEPDR